MKVTITKVFSAALVLLLAGACTSTKTIKGQQEARAKLASKGIAFHETSFISAAKYGKTDVVKEFIAAGMDVNINVDGTALIAATASKNLPMVKLLITNGADVNETNYLGSALNAAIYVGRHDIAQYLIDSGADVNLAAGDGTNPIIIAAQTGRAEMVELLDKAGANVNYQMPVTGLTPLIYAVSKGYLAAAEQLVKAGADVNYKDYTGMHVLVWALLGNFTDVAKMLIENGANPNLDRVLIAALAHNDTQFVGFLIKKGADINGKAFGTMPYIVWCAKNNVVKGAEILVKYGVNTKAVDQSGASALDYALSNREYDLVKVLDPSININNLPKKIGDPNLVASTLDGVTATISSPSAPPAGNSIVAPSTSSGVDGIDSSSYIPSNASDAVVEGANHYTGNDTSSTSGDTKADPYGIYNADSPKVTSPSELLNADNLHMGDTMDETSKVPSTPAQEKSNMTDIMTSDVTPSNSGDLPSTKLRNALEKSNTTGITADTVVPGQTQDTSVNLNQANKDIKKTLSEPNTTGITADAVVPGQAQDTNVNLNKASQQVKSVIDSPGNAAQMPAPYSSNSNGGQETFDPSSK